jgi:dihydroorotate dehydrogenase (fumarate)
MTDLTTAYLGLRLENPVVCSSSPLCQDLGSLKRMEEAGAAAVVLHSLFEEQILIESNDLVHNLEYGTDVYAESLSYFPNMVDYNLGPEGYLEHLREAKALLRIPVIASFNGTTRGGWIDFARQIQEAGADALELNLYFLPANAALTGVDLEDRYIDIVREVCKELRIPVAVKLGPFFTAPANIGLRLANAGARGLVLFNRFYQPDLDLDTMEVRPRLTLSTPDELLLRLHWVAMLYGQVQADLAVTGGVHSGRDVVKVLLAGGSAAMTTSALLKQGVEHIKTMLDEFSEWVNEHEYKSVEQMRGSMSLAAVPDPTAYERANYLKVLRSYSLGAATGFPL